MDEPALEVEKLQELLVRSMHLHVDALAFDRELSPSQLRNIATATDLKVLDRTQLILDIFAQRATSPGRKTQVELAQLRYRMPRLTLMPAMSRAPHRWNWGSWTRRNQIKCVSAGHKATHLSRTAVKKSQQESARVTTWRRQRRSVPGDGSHH